MEYLVFAFPWLNLLGTRDRCILLHMKQMVYAIKIIHWFALIRYIFTDHGNI